MNRSKPIDVEAKAQLVNLEGGCLNVKFKIYPDKINVLYGHSGGGKTTLLKSIIGISSGFSVDLSADLPECAYYVAQHDFIIPGSITSNLFFEDIRSLSVVKLLKANQLLNKLGMGYLDCNRDTYNVYGRLSGGERRRVSIIRALMSDNHVIYLDEPTAGLDPKMESCVFDLLEDFMIDKMIILVSHADLSSRCDEKYNMVQI